MSIEKRESMSTGENREETTEGIEGEGKEFKEGAIKEQKVSVSERQKDIINKVAEEMKLDIMLESSKELEPPIIDVIFESSDEKMKEFIRRVRKLDGQDVSDDE